jgi:tetratricopeptide (TPR) repeat protein
MPNLVTEADLPPNLRSLVQKADGAIQAQNVGYAVQLLLPVVKAEPNFLEGRRKLRKAAAASKKNAGKKFFGGLGGGGLSLMKVQSKVKKEPLAALSELEDTLAEDPFNPHANTLLFDAASTLDMPETAAFALETIKEGHPTDTKNMHKLASLYMAQEQPEKAADIFQAILRVDNTDGEARKGITNANARASIVRQGWGKSESVRDLLRSKEQTKSLEDDSRRGMTPEQIDARLAEWGQKYNEDPSNLSTVKRIAELYDQKEDHQSSLQWYEYAYSLSGGDTSLQAKVQHLRERIDDLNLHALKQEIEANPEAPDIEQKRESLDQLRHARVEKQIVSTRERVEKNPTDLQLRFEFGAALYAGGQFSEAIQELQKAKHNPNIRTRSMLMLARCYEKKGIYDLAVRQLTECAGEIMAMDTVKKEVLYFMGQIYEKMGQAKEALEAFKQIYEVDYAYLDVAQRVEASYT